MTRAYAPVSNIIVVGSISYIHIVSIYILYMIIVENTKNCSALTCPVKFLDDSSSEELQAVGPVAGNWAGKALFGVGSPT